MVHQFQLAFGGGATTQVLQGNAGQTRQMPGQQARGFLGVEAVGGDEGILQVAQLLLQALGEELLIEAGWWGLVGQGWAGAGERGASEGPHKRSHRADNEILSRLD